MDDQEIKINNESKITMINEFRQHLFRSLDIKTLISKDLILGSYNLQKNINDDEGLRLFKRAYKNEFPFLELVSKGLDKSNAFLFESNNWLKSVSTNSTLFSKIEKLNEMLNIFNSNFEQSMKRFKQENYFLNNLDGDSFQKFMISWANEIHSIKTMLTSVNPSDLDDYFKRINVDNRLALRAGFGSDNFYEIVKNWGVSFKDNDDFSLYFSYCSLLGSISLMIVTFHELESSIDKVNRDTLKDLNVDV